MVYEYDYSDFPLAYLITLRCYGTWLHGDGRGTVERHGQNLYGLPRLAPDSELEDLMRQKMKSQQFLLTQEQRAIVEEAISEVCCVRGYDLQAVNARSNHVHAVVSAQLKPEQIGNSFKSYATRKLREAHQVSKQTKLWGRGLSRLYLWKPRQVSLAIEYVLYGQGDIPDFTAET